MSPDEDLNAGGEEVSDAPAPTIESLTGEAMDAYYAGDKETAEALIADRHALAQELFEHNPKREADGPVEPETAASWADTEDAIFEIPEGVLLMESLGPDGSVKVRKALGLITRNDNLRSRFEKAGDKAQVDMIASVIEMGLAHDEAPLLMNTAPREPDPSPTTRLEAQRQINALNEKYPPGTEGYKKPEVRARRENLYRIVCGDTPIVGMQGRIV